MTKEKLMETFKAMADNAYGCAKGFKESGNMEQYKIMMAEERAYMTVIEMIKDNEYAKDIRKIFITE